MKKWLLLSIGLWFSWIAGAEASLKISMQKMDGTKIGYVRADDTIYGLMLTPFLSHLSPGVHGFHVYTFPFCKNKAVAADGHWDPVGRDEHRGPYDAGHLGDLPVLIVNEKGKAILPVLAPRLRLEQIKGRALIVETGGDNYSDSPFENGGQKSPLACGEIPYFN